MIKIWNNKTIKSGIKSAVVFEKKSSEDKIITDFHYNGIPKEGSHCTYLSIILIDLFLIIELKLLSTGVSTKMQIHFQRKKDQQIY